MKGLDRDLNDFFGFARSAVLPKKPTVPTERGGSETHRPSLFGVLQVEDKPVKSAGSRQRVLWAMPEIRDAGKMLRG